MGRGESNAIGTPASAASIGRECTVFLATVCSTLHNYDGLMMHMRQNCSRPGLACPLVINHFCLQAVAEGQNRGWHPVFSCCQLLSFFHKRLVLGRYL